MTLKDFKEMINRTVFCAMGERGYFFYGVLLKKLEGKLVMIASSNSMMGFAIKDVGNDFPDFDKVIISPKVLQKIAKRKRDKSKVSISVSEKTINFNIGSSSISADLMFDFFPRISPNAEEFSKRFPTPYSFVAERLPLIEALKMASAITTFTFVKVAFFLSPGTINLKIFDDEDIAEVEVPCNYSGEDIDFQVDAKYLTESLEHIDTENVNIRIDSNRKIAVIPEPEQDYHFLLAQILRNKNTNKEEKQT